MPAINPSLIPTIPPGDLFKALTTDQSLNIRWLTPLDPVFYEIFNRPHADVAVRQLVLAKAIDQLNASVGKQAYYPFLIQPRIAAGSGDVDVPHGWLWDMSAAMPSHWERLRLAKIKRLSGTNPPADATGDETGASAYTGKLSLIFTANEQNSNTEVAIFQADYQIDSQLTYQPVRLSVVTASGTSASEDNLLSQSAQATVAGFVIFKTMDLDELIVQSFLNTVKPDTGTAGNPAVYELVDYVPDDLSGDFSTQVLKHGTGLLTNSAWNAMPPVDSDVLTWITSFNYPFDANANRTSLDAIAIPNGLFREFDMTAPAGDQPTGDTSGEFYPVWLGRIERIGDTTNQLRLYFSTYNVTDEAAGGEPSLNAIEFATLDINSNMQPGEVVEIVPLMNLQLVSGTDAFLAGQHLGRGHVVLSSLWASTTHVVQDFFDAFGSMTGSPANTNFVPSATRLSSFGLSRVPKYTPTIGQAYALRGSTSRLTPPVAPSYDNRFVTEREQGFGDTIDLDSQPGVTMHPAIDRDGQSGALCHRIIRLVVNSTKTTSGDNTFYETYILPRLRILLGRDPVFGDFWFNGTRLLFFNGDTWQG